MKTIVWYRNDLRIHDHPALHAAAEEGDVLPVFVLDGALLKSSRVSSNRNRFLIESLNDLKESLRNVGSDLVILDGKPDVELVKFAKMVKADAVNYSIDYTPYARKRDEKMFHSLKDEGIAMNGYGGRLIVDSVKDLVTKTNSTYKVFTPFYKNWLTVGRRDVIDAPRSLPKIGSDVKIGRIPQIVQFTEEDNLSKDALKGGEAKGRERIDAFLENDIRSYKQASNDMGMDKTSRMSSYLHFGCVSPREIEYMLGQSQADQSYRRQLAWRDFYHYILLHHPSNTHQEFQERYRKASWSTDTDKFDAWREGRTGYPVVDAAMIQLRQEGWMHNRARLIVGSFLTKDLGIDWRLGEKHFLEWLIDGDMANNNGNWQWIASVGVDPAPLFRRLYNPSSQQDKYDPDGLYVRKYLPVMAKVPNKHLGAPWDMSPIDQIDYGCKIGEDYPSPIVDHATARKEAIEWYKQSAS